MKSAFCALVVFAFLASHNLMANDKDLVGVWMATEATQNGEKLDKDFFSDNVVEFKSDKKYTATLSGVKDEGTFSVDWSKKPATIDMKPKSGAASGTTMTGILELKADTLRLSFNLETSERPKDFTSTEKNKHFVVVYQRKK